eukprot:3501383-Alexandrium_andersonii.AAC.1
MSASLVGSEMCIRDSSGAPGSSGELRFTVLRLVVLRVLRVLCRPCLQSPVSYTHLTLPTICSV